jgi:ABC-type lipoprotein release transport system permease subunit
VNIKAQNDRPLPIKIFPDEIVFGAVVASLIAVVATTLAAVAAWRAAENSKSVVEEQLRILRELEEKRHI